MRYEVIESKQWQSDDGRTASIYGSVPWKNENDKKKWKIVTVGYTIRDNKSGTVGMGRRPFSDKSDAEKYAEKLNAGARHFI